MVVLNGLSISRVQTEIVMKMLFNLLVQVIITPKVDRRSAGQ
jgi:hypothetical protein